MAEIDPNLISGLIGGGSTLLIKIAYDYYKKIDKINPMENQIKSIKELLVEFKPFITQIPILSERVGRLESNEKTIFTRIDEQRRIYDESKKTQ